MMRAYFAGGCFWCLAPVFRIYGTEQVMAGYCGGQEANPEYLQVKHQTTGHRETIMVEYEPEKVSYQTLLEIYLANIDPFDDEGQYIDRGFSYSPAIYYTSEAERELAEQKLGEIAQREGKPTKVAVEPYGQFWPAEEEHQDYYLKNPEAFALELEESGRKPL